MLKTLDNTLGTWINTAGLMRQGDEEVAPEMVAVPVRKFVQTTDGWQMVEMRPACKTPRWKNLARENFDGIKGDDYEQTLTEFFACEGMGWERATTETIWRAGLRLCQRLNMDGNSALTLARAITIATGKRKGVELTLLDIGI